MTKGAHGGGVPAVASDGGAIHSVLPSGKIRPVGRQSTIGVLPTIGVLQGGGGPGGGGRVGLGGAHSTPAVASDGGGIHVRSLPGLV